MAIVFDKLIGEVLLHNHNKIVTSDPASGQDGDMIINTTTNTYKMWYSNEWKTLHTFTIEELFMLQEDGDFLLQEDTDKLIL